MTLTGFVHSADLYAMVDKAEREEDNRIWLEGLQIGKRYHIRQAYYHDRFDLQTGNYVVTAVDPWHGPNCEKAFQVEGDDRWYYRDTNQNLIFCEVEEQGK